MTDSTVSGKRHATRRRARQSLRASRMHARGVLWDRNDTLPRIRACGLRGQANAEGVAFVRTPVKEASGLSMRGGVSGVQSCGSVWGCPVCSERIQAQRQADVSAAIRAAHARGWVVAFLTFTVRHSGRHPLAGVWGAVSAGWRAATSGSRSAWERDRSDFGVQGYVRLVETTVSPVKSGNGWHVHVHALFFLDPATAMLTQPVRPREAARQTLGRGGVLGVREVEALADSMRARWNAGVKSIGRGYAPSREHGVDARLVIDADDDLGKYFTKGTYTGPEHLRETIRGSADGVASEVTLSAHKSGRGSNVTPFGLLAILVGDADAPEGFDPVHGWRLWRTWLKESKGKRQLLFSNGLRDALDLAPEVSDEDAANDDALKGTEVLRVTIKGYRRLARAGGLSRALDALEAPDDGHALIAVLEQFRVGWDLPPPIPDLRRVA